MCNTTRRQNGSKVIAERKAALAAVTKELLDSSADFSVVAVKKIITATCGDVIDNTQRIRLEKRKTGIRVKLPLVAGAQVFGPACHAAYAAMKELFVAPGFAVERVGDAASKKWDAIVVRLITELPAAE